MEGMAKAWEGCDVMGIVKKNGQVKPPETAALH